MNNSHLGSSRQGYAKVRAPFDRKEDNKWPAKYITLLTSETGPQKLLNDLVRPIGWIVKAVAHTPEQAIERVAARQGHAIVIIDSQDISSAESMVTFSRHPFTCALPTLCITKDATEKTTKILHELGKTKVCHIPITMKNVIPQFSSLQSESEMHLYTTFRKVIYQLILSGPQVALPKVIKLHEIEELQIYTSLIISYYYLKLNKVAEAEKILLAVLKANPRSLSVILRLSQLYLDYAMPKLTFKLLDRICQIYGYSEAIYPGLIQSAILMNKLDFARDLLSKLHKDGKLSARYLDVYGRLLFASGQERLAEELMKDYRQRFKSIKANWNKALDISYQSSISNVSYTQTNQVCKNR